MWIRLSMMKSVVSIPFSQFVICYSNRSSHKPVPFTFSICCISGVQYARLTQHTVAAATQMRHCCPVLSAGLNVMNFALAYTQNCKSITKWPEAWQLYRLKYRFATIISHRTPHVCMIRYWWTAAHAVDCGPQKSLMKQSSVQRKVFHDLVLPTRGQNGWDLRWQTRRHDQQRQMLRTMTLPSPQCE